MQATNTSIKVFQECLPNSTERVVALGGGEDELVNVLTKILEIMQESPIKGNVALYDPSQEQWNGPNDNFGGPPMSGMGMGGGNQRGGMRGGMRGGRGGNQNMGRGGFQGGFQGGPGGNFGGNRGGGGSGGGFSGPMVSYYIVTLH